MPWGYDDWLKDRAARQGWMRSVALVQLTEQILRTPAVAGEGLACILDEVLGGADSPTASQVERSIAEDVGRANAWVRTAIAAARAQAVTFEAVALMLPDGAPYRLRVALANGPVRGDVEWADSITWRSSDHFAPAVLDTLLPLFGRLPAHVQIEADHVVPLAYSAFLLRDVLRSAADAAEWHPVREAIVAYDGGDSVNVPMN